MKRLFYLCAMLATISSCSDKIELDIPCIGSSEGTPFTVSLTMPGKSDTKAISDYGNTDPKKWNFTWETSDYAYAIYPSSLPAIDVTSLSPDQSSLSDDGTSMIFHGSLSSGKTYGLMYAKGKEDCGLPAISEQGKYYLPVDYTTQDGDLGGTVGEVTSGFMMVSKSFLVEGTDVPAYNPTLKHVGGFLVLNLSFTNVPPCMDGVTVEKVVLSGLNSKGEVDYSKDAADADFYVSNSDSDYITVTPKTDIEVKADVATSLYINIMPTTLTAESQLVSKVYLSNGAILSMSFTPSADVELPRAQFSTINRVYDLSLADKEGENNDVAITGMFQDSNSDPLEYSAAEDEYYISTVEQLETLSALTNFGVLVSRAASSPATFKLANDIQVNSTDYDWSPIGYTSSTQFKGTLDGLGHSIIGAKVDGGDGVYGSVGLFGYAEGAGTVIKNVVANSCEVTITATGGTHAAVLVGTLKDGAKLLNCGCDHNSSVTQIGNGAIGGLVGDADGSTTNKCAIENCYNQASVTSKGTGNVSIGGISGKGYAVVVNNSYNSGTVTYNSSASGLSRGALLGNNGQNRTLTDCFYITGCAGEGVMSVAYNNKTTDSEDFMTNVKPKDSLNNDDMMIGNIYNNNFSYCSWINSTNGPLFDWRGYAFN